MLLDLIYFDTRIGEAVVDDRHLLLNGLIWRIEIPRTVRRLAHGRPDVTLSLLRESPEYLQRCRVHTNFTVGCIIRLTHVVLRPDLVGYLVKGDTDVMTLARIRELSSSVKRVVSLNGNRLDCRRENLREVV